MTDREASCEKFEEWVFQEKMMSGITIRESEFARKAWQASRQQALSEPNVYDQALRKILGVVQRYLPPDSPITEKEALSEIISIVDPGPWPWPAGPHPPPHGPTGDKA